MIINMVARDLRQKFPNVPQLGVSLNELVLEAPVDNTGVMTTMGLRLRDFVSKYNGQVRVVPGPKEWTIVAVGGW